MALMQTVIWISRIEDEGDMMVSNMIHCVSDLHYNLSISLITKYVVLTFEWLLLLTLFIRKL
jgi:hypothetical protein